MKKGLLPGLMRVMSSTNILHQAIAPQHRIDAQALSRVQRPTSSSVCWSVRGVGGRPSSMLR